MNNWCEKFWQTSRSFEDKVAVIHNDESITFADLEKQSMLLSSEIKNRYKGYNRPVLVLLPKSISLVIANIGIMGSRNIFSNLDVKTPSERLNNIIKNLNPVGIISNKKEVSKISIPKECFYIDIEEVLDAGLVLEKNIIDTIKMDIDQAIDTDPFCIINTSGSTGTPKGVVLNHRSFFDFMEWSLNTFELSSKDVIASLSPAVFDIYDYELCLMIWQGATMVLLDATMAAFPAKLLSEMTKFKTSFMFWVPTIMVNIANMNLLSKIDLSFVRTIWFAGEVFPTKQFNYWRKKLPQATFANLYGPIEITLDCIFYKIDDIYPEEEALPIGIPCHNTDILLLDENNGLCNVDEDGEICVRGSSLAMGYYNDPEKTSAAFTQNPLNRLYPELIYRTGDIAYKSSKDNLYHFKGRKDSLIKHMGYRIELGEIEHELVDNLKMVKNCCAVYDYKKKEIVLYYEKEKYDFLEMKKQLASIFPRYMVPGRWEELKELPRNTNGKIDRLFLSERVNS